MPRRRIPEPEEFDYITFALNDLPGSPPEELYQQPFRSQTTMYLSQDNVHLTMTEGISMTCSHGTGASDKVPRFSGEIDFFATYNGVRYEYRAGYIEGKLEHLRCLSPLPDTNDEED